MKYLWTIVSLCLSFGLYAQELVGAGGEEASLPNLQMSYSIGEVVTTTNTAPGITQGYQQPNLTVTAIDEHTFETTVSIYPNPTESFVQVDLGEASPFTALELYTPNGQLLWRKDIAGEQREEIDFRAFANGTYFLVFDAGSTKQTYQIVKTR